MRRTFSRGSERAVVPCPCPARPLPPFRTGPVPPRSLACCCALQGPYSDEGFRQQSGDKMWTYWHQEAQTRLDICDALIELEESGCVTPMLRGALHTFFKLIREEVSGQSEESFA